MTVPWLESANREACEWKKFFERFTFKHPFMGGVMVMRFDVTQHAVQISIPMQVPDRDTGAMTVVTFGSTVDFSGLEHYKQRDNAQLVAYVHTIVHNAIRSALMHEVDEMLCFDGEVVCDPHAKEEPDVGPSNAITNIDVGLTTASLPWPKR